MDSIMDNIRVLVTGVGGAAGIVTLKSLNNQNIYTIGVNCYKLTAGFKLSNDYLVVPFAKDDNYLDQIIDICKTKKVNIVIPTVDEELLIYSKNKDLFNRLGVDVAISDTSVLNNCLDKWLCNKKLEKHNIPVPLTWLANEKINANELIFPLIAKPRIGRGSRGIKIITCENELKLFENKNPDYLIQEYVDGDEFTVDTLSDFNGKAIIAVPRKRIEVKGGVCWKGNTLKDDRIIKICMEAVEAVGIKGPACVQLKFSTKGEVKVFEINPRIGGTTSLTIASGVDIPYLTVKLLLNKEISPEELQFRQLYISRYFEDVFFEENEIE